MKDNKGFSLVTVIIAVAFIGILGMLVLYIALQNFNMKTAGIKGKDGFYTAEQALEEIRLGLQQDVGASMSAAYIEVMEDYNKKSDSADTVLDELRQKEFEETFLEMLTARVRGSEKNGQSELPLNQYSMDYLRGYVDLDQMDDFDKSTETLIVTTADGRTPVIASDAEKGLLLKNLKVIYVDAKGYASIIETDIRLGIPKIQFPTPSTLPDLMNMVVVAQGGIVCKASERVTASAALTSITGSIYAGNLENSNTSDSMSTSIQIEKNAALSIASGDKIVTSGEIAVDEKGTFSTKSGVILWTHGVRMTEGNVTLSGTTYVADDLTVEKNAKSSDGSQVVIAGEYYGFGSPDSAKESKNYTQTGQTKENDLPRLYDTLSDADLSSGIVINGRNTTIDLSGVKKFLLAGRNYIAVSGVKGTAGTAANKDVMLGESLSVKGSQLAYLVPAALLKTGSKVSASNPMNYDDYRASDLMKKDDDQQVDWDETVSAWGGKSLSEIGVDKSKPIQTVFYNDNAGGGYVYFYLNFTDNEKASDFMQTYAANSTNKLNQDLSFYFGKNSGITVADRDSYVRYVTNGNILTYDGNDAEGSLEDATNAASDEKLQQEQVNMQNTWYALNRKMITSVDLLNTGVKDSEGISHDEASYTRSVFDNLVNEKQMVEFLQKKNRDKLQYTFTASDDDGSLQAIMVHNGASSTYQTLNGSKTVKGTGKPLEITQQMAETDNLRLVICTGDVVIASGVHFKGIIMAKGKITLEAGASLESAPLEAAKVFQSVVETDNHISPKDFFWEGDKYVLGNSNVTKEDGESTSDTYQLGDYITYENWRKE